LPTYILAFDDSESAKKALRRTVELVSPRDLIVLVWVEPAEDIFQTIPVEGDGSGAAARLERLNAAVAACRREGRQAAALLLKGDVAKQIVDTADRLEADMIILGHKGVSRIGAFALGSVAERVVEASKRKVLIVK
jgi:nucleotide-binding universal stress UspA family protein